MEKQYVVFLGYVWKIRQQKIKKLENSSAPTVVGMFLTYKVAEAVAQMCSVNILKIHWKASVSESIF